MAIQFKKFYPMVLEMEKSGQFQVGVRKKDNDEIKKIPEYFKSNLQYNPLNPIVMKKFLMNS